MTVTRKPRPRDPLQLAKLIGDIATGQVEDREDDGKDAAMSELGRQGGLRGGKARSEKLTAEKRRQIAQTAANSRWKNR
jgi:hypothetical protein